MLPRLEALLQASPQVASFHVIDNDPTDEDNFLLKIRCELTSGQALQIRLHAVASYLRYSYQACTDTPVRRWDNAPHVPQFPNFPHHYHDPQGNVTASALTGDPAAPMRSSGVPLCLPRVPGHGNSHHYAASVNRGGGLAR